MPLLVTLALDFGPSGDSTPQERADRFPDELAESWNQMMFNYTLKEVHDAVNEEIFRHCGQSMEKDVGKSVDAVNCFASTDWAPQSGHHEGKAIVFASVPGGAVQWTFKSSTSKLVVVGATCVIEGA